MSVIVPVGDGGTDLDSLLSALGRQSIAMPFEVIVVNNGRPKDLVPFEAAYPWVTFEFEPMPGSYAARNRGIRRAKGFILAFTDADCIPADGWLEAGVKAVREMGGWGLVGGRVETFPRDPGCPNCCELYDMVCSFRQEHNVSRYGFGVTANVFTTARTMAMVGVFDERWASGGDCDWGMRVSRRGLPRRYCAAAVVAHPATGSLEALLRKSRRVTIGTMHTVERASSYGMWRYVVHQLLERPQRVWKELAQYRSGGSGFMKVKVLALYYVLKVVQGVERGRYAWAKRGEVVRVAREEEW